MDQPQDLSLKSRVIHNEHIQGHNHHNHTVIVQPATPGSHPVTPQALPASGIISPGVTAPNLAGGYYVPDYTVVSGMYIGQTVGDHNTGKRRVKCNTCGNTYCDKGALKIHYGAVHKKEKHKCTIQGCNKTFSSRRSRNRHSENTSRKLHDPSYARHRSASQLSEGSDFGEDSMEIEDEQPPSPETTGRSSVQGYHTEPKVVEAVRPSSNPAPARVSPEQGMVGSRKRKGVAPSKIEASECSELVEIDDATRSPAKVGVDPIKGLTSLTDNLIGTAPRLIMDEGPSRKPSIVVVSEPIEPAVAPKRPKPIWSAESLISHEPKGPQKAVDSRNGHGIPHPTSAHQSPLSHDRMPRTPHGELGQDFVSGRITYSTCKTPSGPVSIPVDEHNPRRCVQCNKLFQNHFSVKTHYLNVHLKVMHKCMVEGCNAAFPSKRSRDRHSQNRNMHQKLLTTGQHIRPRGPPSLLPGMSLPLPQASAYPSFGATQPMPATLFWKMLLEQCYGKPAWQAASNLSPSSSSGSGATDESLHMVKVEETDKN